MSFDEYQQANREFGPQVASMLLATAATDARGDRARVHWGWCVFTGVLSSALTMAWLFGWFA